MDGTETLSDKEQTVQRRTRSRVLAVAFIILLITIAAITLPLINVSRYRRRIAMTMSQSLGRPVHLDDVSLHLLPWPGLTLKNLVVSEDPAFGYEPVIRANKVTATLRISSLWRRQMEFSTVRFDVDDYGSGPSVNIVRNPQGRWNLEDILKQASQVNTAPTEQRRAGPAPRFPYIEARGARVNVKLGNEKMPYSLTDAEFALWLPSPAQWRVRLQGRPTRTDRNVPEAGELRVEGSLRRAGSMAEVPVDLHASWRGAPLGQTSSLLTGDDAGWRGALFLEAALTGPLSSGNLVTHLQLNDLRRADFVPPNTLDVTVDCSATTDALTLTLINAQCKVPVDETSPLILTAATVDVQKPKAAPAKLVATSVPASWVLGWAKLFSRSIAPALEPAGTVNGELDWNPEAASWQGRLSAALPPLPTDASIRETSGPATATTFHFDVDTAPLPGPVFPAPIVRLQPVTLQPALSSSFQLSGQADVSGYKLQLAGSGTGEQVRALAAKFPPFSEGLDLALTNTTSSTNRADAPRPIALTCSRLWNGTQTCEPLVQVEPTKTQRPARRSVRHAR